MKTTFIMGAMSVALLTAVSCSETETDINPAGGGSDTQAALGVNATVRTDGMTKAVVDYKKITYPDNQYTDADYAPGLGVVLTNSDATAWYNDAISGYGGHHIWFMGDKDGANWTSITGKGTGFGNADTKDYNLSVEVGRVYAYYPYDTNITSSLPAGTTFAEDDLKIPVSVKTTGTIEAATSNADKVWDAGTSKWISKDVTKGDYIVTLADKSEKDYLYFDGGATGGTISRYVNNGHAGNAAASNNNEDATNPGSAITLAMKHACSMVSFRVYDGGNLGTAGAVKFTKFKIEDNGGSFLNVANGTMLLKDGSMGFTASTAGSIERTVNEYTLVQQIPSGAETENTFIENTGDGVTGASVSKIVSAIVYPTDFSSPSTSSLKLTVTLKEGTNAAQEYTVNIPAKNWEANKNYLYTLSAGRNKLSITDVTVTEWTVVNGGELPL